jgi:glycosyltransferase involved in cell wall biosynthesis
MAYCISNYKSEESQMKTSFIIIAYNEERNISNAINSILKQDELKNYEIIVVNDASQDKTVKIIKNFSKNNKNIKLIDLKKNQGRGNARDTGVKNAKGDYIAFIDADIILPKNWLNTCLKEIKKYDVVGGIAVPDGDAMYIHDKFELKAKIKPHTIEVSGSNGFYKKKVFDKINFNSKLKDGEDFEFIQILKKNKFSLKSIKNLIVKHRENKNYIESLKWLYQSGTGSMRLLKRHKNIRLPDLAFFGFVFLLLVNIVEIIINKSTYSLVLTLLYFLLTSFLHINSKFFLSKDKTWDYFIAIIYNYPFMVGYYFGKLKGVFRG